MPGTRRPGPARRRPRPPPGGIWTATTILRAASRPREADSAARRSASTQNVEELADLSRAGERIGHGKVGLDRVAVAAAVALAGYVAGGDEIADDAVGGALGDPDRLADLAQADAGGLRDAHQGLRVVCEKRPCRRTVHVHNARLGFLD